MARNRRSTARSSSRRGNSGQVEKWKRKLNSAACACFPPFASLLSGMERSVYHSAGTREEELFTIKSRSYKQQYANLYWLRLVALRKLLLRTARRKWASLARQSADSFPFPSIPDFTPSLQRRLYTSPEYWTSLRGRYPTSSEPSIWI